MPRILPLLAVLLVLGACSSMPGGGDPVRGKTMRWTWTKGPTLGTTHEHAFNHDGTMDWTILDGPAMSKSGREKQYASVKVADDVYAVSYLSLSGYTVTVVLNFGDRRIVGFASNAREWHPVEGSFQVVK